MSIFKQELEQTDLEAIKEEHAQKENKAKLEKAIAKRKAQMDRLNEKVERKAKRTSESKHYIFQTR